MTFRITLMAGSMVMALASAAAAQAPPVRVEFNAEARAVVETVDTEKREVLLRDETGFLTTYEVGPDVRNLPNLRPGDRIVRSFHLDMLAAVAQPGSAAPASETVDARRPPQGARPGERVADVRRARVTIEGVDIPTRTVALIGPAGMPRRFTLQSPQMLDFARGLKPGDQVDLTFTEVSDLRVEPR